MITNGRNREVKPTKKEKAIAVYLDDSDNMETELSWLYKSWLVNGLNKEWDLVVYYNPTAEERVRRFGGTFQVPLKPQRMADDYPFLNSHYFCLPEYNEFLKSYKYLLKTDCDTFVTHNLKGYDPGEKFHYGLAQYYGAKDTAAKIHWMKYELAPMLSLAGGNVKCDHQYMTNVGASFLGKSDWVLQMTSHQAMLTEQILKIFQASPYQAVVNQLDAEKAFKSLQKVMGPGLMEGIASMIGGELAVNSTLYPQHVNPWSLDSKCWKATQLSTNVIHIHAWHTQDKFSKHEFFKGSYEDWTVHYDNRLDNCANYCQWIATTPLEEIKEIAKKIT